jgi:hypothetical protein
MRRVRNFPKIWPGLYFDAGEGGWFDISKYPARYLSSSFPFLEQGQITSILYLGVLAGLAPLEDLRTKASRNILISRPRSLAYVVIGAMQTILGSYLSVKCIEMYCCDAICEDSEITYVKPDYTRFYRF